MLSSQDNSVTDVNILNQNDLPHDTVSDIQWSPASGSMFSCTGWDGKARIYDIQANMNQYSIVQRLCVDLQEPSLCNNWSPDGKYLVTGGIDAAVKLIDLEKGQSMIIGKHDHAVRNVFWLPNNLIMSMSFDKSIRVWNPATQQPVGVIPINHKIYCAEVVGDVVVLGTDNEQLAVFNKKLLENPNCIKFVKNPLETQVTAICIKYIQSNMSSYHSKPKASIGIGSFDGRGHISEIIEEGDGNYKLESVMTFKCHRLEGPSAPGNANTLYPVNAIVFNPRKDCFIATCGGEGCINYWDYMKKNKIKAFNFNKVPVTAARVSNDGQLMAYAIGYDWSMGIWGLDGINYRPKICVHNILEDELFYKPQF